MTSPSLSLGLLAILVSLALVAPGCATTSGRSSGGDAVVVVTLTGRGATTSEARQNAILNALRRVVGEYVDARTIVLDDEIVEDEIRSFTRSNSIASEQVGPVRRVDGEYEVTMTVEVTPTNLDRSLRRRAARASVGADGSALVAELDVARDGLESQRRILGERFARIPRDWLEIELVDRDGDPLRGIDRSLVRRSSASQVDLVVLVRLTHDQDGWEAYRGELVELLDAVTGGRVGRARFDAQRYGSPYARGRVPVIDAEAFSVESETIKVRRPDGFTDQQELVVVLREARKFLLGGDSGDLDFDLYWLDRTITAGLDVERAQPRVRIDFLDDQGRTLATRTRSLEGACAIRLPQGWGNFSDADFIENGIQGISPPTGGLVRSRRDSTGISFEYDGDIRGLQPIVIAPRWWSWRSHAVDAIARFEISIHPATLSRVRSIEATAVWSGD